MFHFCVTVLRQVKLQRDEVTIKKDYYRIGHRLIRAG